MTDIIIPLAALEAGAREITFALMHAVDEDHALPLTDDERAELARAAIAAAINAWPNAKTLRDDGRRQTYIVPAIILPLSQQVRDE